LGIAHEGGDYIFVSMQILLCILNQYPGFFVVA